MKGFIPEKNRDGRYTYVTESMSTGMNGTKLGRMVSYLSTRSLLRVIGVVSERVVCIKKGAVHTEQLLLYSEESERPYKSITIVVLMGSML